MRRLGKRNSMTLNVTDFSLGLSRHADLPHENLPITNDSGPAIPSPVGIAVSLLAKAPTRGGAIRGWMLTSRVMPPSGKSS